MKPERLEMSGFTAFRSPTEIDFSGLELFALTGPTGAGKSSVIDAITFALYGVVARYDDQRSVEPVITLGAAEARVRFDFLLEERRYTAVRVVRRTSRGGATTAEARLETEGRVAASGAKEVTEAVERLLGLGFRHFTRSVVLPQGEFAAFLHDKPAGQQELVKALLELGFLDRIRGLALGRQRTAESVAEAGRARLQALADATEEAEMAAGERVRSLEALESVVKAAEDEIAQAEAAHRQGSEQLEKLRGDLRLLAAVQVPAGIGELASEIAAARETSNSSLETVRRSRQAVDDTRGMLAVLPSADRLEAADALRRRQSEAEERLVQLDVAAAETVRSESRRDHAAAEAAHEAAVARLEEASRLHTAHALVASLETGDPCPVCRRPLEDGVWAEVPQDLTAAQTGVGTAKAALQAAAGRLRSSESTLADVRARLESTQGEMEDLRRQLADHPDAAETETARERRAGAEKAVEEAVGQLRAAEKEAEAAASRVEKLLEREKAARSEFDRLRDEVAPLRPPAAQRTDLAEDWDGLATWAAGAAKRLQEESDEIHTRVEEISQRLSRLGGDLERRLEEAHVEGERDRPASVRLAGAVASARGRLERIRERRAQRADLEGDVKTADVQAEVAQSLGAHLKSNRFEAWMLAEALASLLLGANTLLAELSHGAYSLASGERSIEVIDHRNADERRSVRSLSGGETFLVSLALALSLGQQLADLSERGGARLEAIFLDEGFGTLDAETLDTVASVVADLAAQGRLVGLVTHVKELAEQMPVRFEVQSAPTGSTVTRIES